MGIYYHEKTKEFHLYNDEISYVITILPNGQAGQLYFGRRIKDRESFSHLQEYCRRDMAAYVLPDFSMEHVRQEYPVYGRGDVRQTAMVVRRANGSCVTGFSYIGYKIYKGKERLLGLPATYVEQEGEAQSLELTFRDERLQLEYTLNYTVFSERPAIARSARITNLGGEDVELLRVMSMCLDLPDAEYEMIDLCGAWARERTPHFHELHRGVQNVGSIRGCSSHQFNPFLALKRREATEHSGEVLGFSLVYSGNFLAQVERDNFDVARVTLGIHPEGFCWTLKRGESFQTPEAVLVYSREGVNGMSQIYHELYRERLARGYWRDRVRPILINNWEATYFKFDEEKLLAIADKAKELGVELFVLDDGWFGRRNDDTTSLGDWSPNLEKLPGGIKGIAEKITSKGVRFGLWFEPEMISEDSDLYRAHPDWVLADPDYPKSPSRNQYVLDFSRKEIVEYIAEQMERILTKAPVSYIKWDMNRSMSEVFSSGQGREAQGKVMHEYILGVYSLYERLTKKFPEVLFESCASGGARFDPGMLYYAPQGWISDNTDAVERLKIQYGTSLVYPLSSMGSHVSASPNHQMGRNTSIDMRADVAYFGTFGYELDLNQISEEEQEKVKEQICFMKAHRRFIQTGRFFRLKSPFEGNEAAWMVVAPDKRYAVVGYYRILQPVNIGYHRLYLQGLDKDVVYLIEGREGEYYGDELMFVGMRLGDYAAGERTTDVAQTDYSSRLFILRAKED